MSSEHGYEGPTYYRIVDPDVGEGFEEVTDENTILRYPIQAHLIDTVGNLREGFKWGPVSNLTGRRVGDFKHYIFRRPIPKK